MNIIKKARNSYLELGNCTRFIIKITFLIYYTLFFLAIYCNFSVNSPIHYELLLLSDELLESAKMVCGTGFLGIIIIGTIENHS